MDKNSEQITGAGIGLSLVKALVESHNGLIEIDSEYGLGTCVKVNLPIINELENLDFDEKINQEMLDVELSAITDTAKASREQSPSTELNVNGQPLVLVIEDNNDMRTYISDCLSANFKVICASDGKLGLEKANDAVPDLIISDVMMPELNGFETTAKLRENPITNHIPIILLTALGDKENRLKGWRYQADEYLTKPFHVEELTIRVNNLLSIRGILKERFRAMAFENDGIISANSILKRNGSSLLDKEKDNKAKEFIEKLNKILAEKHSDPELVISDIASEMAMSERQFFRKIKALVDMSPTEYLRKTRLEKAKLLLEQGELAKSVCFDVGFSSQSYFGKCFKAMYGMPPSEYRKLL